MHKQEREIKDKEELYEIVRNGKYLTLALSVDSNPYVVTLSYGYDKEANSLYFHTATKGLKFNYISKNPLVCGTIIEDNGYLKGQCSHSYRSIVFIGILKIIDDLTEKKHGLTVLLNHLEEHPDPIREKVLKNDDSYVNVCIMRCDIEEITGKSNKK